MANRGYRKHLRIEEEKRLREAEKAEQALRGEHIVHYTRKEQEEAGISPLPGIQDESHEPSMPDQEVDAINQQFDAGYDEDTGFLRAQQLQDLEDTSSEFPPRDEDFQFDTAAYKIPSSRQDLEEITDGELAEARAMIVRDMNARDTVRLGLLMKKFEEVICRYEMTKKDADASVQENKELLEMLGGKASKENIERLIGLLKDKSGQITRLAKSQKEFVSITSSRSLYDRVPPYNETSERALLGLTLKHPELRAKHSQPYTNLMFFVPFHREIHISMMKVPSLDRFTLVEDLRQRGVLDNVGGEVTIDRLLHEVADVGPGSFDNHWDVVERNYILRCMIAWCRDKEHDIYEQNWNEVPSVPEWIRQASSDLVEKVVPRRFRIHRDLKALVDETTEDFAELIRRKGKPRISTGYLVLDRIMHGIMPGKMHVMGADTKAGKTTLMANLADNVATQGYGTAIFTYESSDKQILHKLIAKRAAFDTEFFEYFEAGQVTDTMIAEVLRAANQEVKQLPIYIEYGKTADLDMIKTRIKQLKIEHPDLSLVIVDGMQSFKGYKPYEGTKASIYSEVLKGLQGDVAVADGITVLLTSQLKTSEVYLRSNMRPYRLNDFPDCTDIPKVVDSAFFLYRPESYIGQEKYRNKKQEGFFTKEHLEAAGLLGKLEIVPVALRVGDRLKKGGWLGCDMATAKIWPLEKRDL